jgi:uncharacterized protein YlzI (FlbEa/FlbD family)
MTFLAAALQLVLIITLDGREVHVNPTHIVSISEARDEDDPHKLLTGKVHCVITLTNGKLISAAEDCTSVRHRIEEK